MSDAKPVFHRRLSVLDAIYIAEAFAFAAFEGAI
jgi:hypothetical protein